MSLDDVADELYGLDPGSFTAVKTAREKEARAAGDRDLAAQIKALRKPSMSAWLTNQLIRERKDQIEPLLALGEQLRELQASVSAEQLRALTQQRHRLVYAVAQEARALGHERGQTVTDAVARELEQTLHAALGDPEAAEAVRSGRLISGLQYAGFGPVSPSSAAAPAKKAAAPVRKDDLAEKRAERAEQLRQARVEAQEVLDRARAGLVDAEASRDEAAAELASAEERLTEARDRVDQIKLDLDDAEEAAEAADHELKGARRAAQNAQKAAVLASQRVTGAEYRLNELPEP
ncbi:hypothetical protein [Cryptosporangium sp. NPDC048952]|uniref:hypothetical protein n=1 Tax=Cryptosporangium sp. NPDC048952 TaxID=3363961 RepID=UPI003710F5A9